MAERQASTLGDFDGAEVPAMNASGVSWAQLSRESGA